MATLDEEEWKKSRHLLVFRSIINYGDENIDKAAKALRDPDYLAQKPRMRAISERLATALNEYKKGTPEGKDAYNSIIAELSAKPHPTYRRLLAEHLGAAGCSFEITVNTPDLSRLVPSNVQDRASGYKRVAENLNNYLEAHQNELSDNAKALFAKVIEAYTKGDAVEIGNLKNAIKTKEDIGAAFLIEQNRGFGIHAPYHEISIKETPAQPAPGRSPVIHQDPGKQDPRQNRLDSVSTRDSDQWNQVLTVGAQTAHNMASNLTEGIVITALKEVMGDKYPDNFADMTLDEQEIVISSLNPAETAKVNISVLEKAQKLAEVLPPHFLTFMAENVDKALADKNIGDDVKKALAAQKGTLLTSMFNQIVSYKRGDLTANPDNAAGVYDGTTEMLNYLKKNLNTLPENRRENAKQCIDFVSKELETAIGAYDENNGLKDVTEKDTKKIEKTYDALAQHVEEIISKNEFEKSLDADTLNIFKKLEFPATKDKDGNDISAEENKKLFIDMVLYSAAQKTAVEAKDKKGKELAEAFKAQLQETTFLETIKLIQAEESVKMAQDPNLADSLKVTAQDNTEEKKKKLKQYIQNLQNNPCTVSANAFAGYAAAKVCQQSLFLNRLATKIKNRGSSLLKKMWKPFEKVDQTCIKRFGNIYTAAKSLVRGNLQNLPWSVGNAIVRTVAFSQIGTPWGLAAVAGYGVYSLGTTAVRMVCQYKKMKKQDASMTPGKFFKNNWSGMALSLVGTAVSVVPGLAAASDIGWLKGALDVMRNSGALEASTIPGASHLGMTNASVGLIGAGLVDSTVRGAIAHHKNGDGWGNAFLKGGLYASASSALGIGTGIGCSMLANEVLPNQHMNTAGDVRTPEIKDGSFDPDNPDHYSETIAPLKFDTPEQAVEFKTSLEHLQSGDLSQAEYQKEYEKLETMLNEHGMSLEKDENGEVKLSWTEQEAKYADGKIKGPDGIERSITEHADFWANDWQKDVPGLHEANTTAIENNTTIKEFNLANPLMKVDTNRMEMIIMLCGGQAVPAEVDTHINHNQYGPDVHVKGNHLCITDKWVENYGNDPELIKHCGNQAITSEEIAQIRGLHNSDGSFNSKNLTPRLLEVINALDHKVSSTFEVGDLEATHGQEQTDGVLGRNGSEDSAGKHQHNDKDPRFYHTYNNAVSARNDIDKTHTDAFNIQQWHEHYYMPTNPSIDLYNIAAGEGMSRIMGQNGQRKHDEINKPIDARGLPKVSGGTQRTSDGTGAPAQAPAKKGNIFSRIFSRGGKGSK